MQNTSAYGKQKPDKPEVCQQYLEHFVRKLFQTIQHFRTTTNISKSAHFDLSEGATDYQHRCYPSQPQRAVMWELSLNPEYNPELDEE